MIPLLDWTVRPRAPRAALERLGVGSSLLAQLLLNRGIGDAAEARRFLDGGDEPLGDPWLMAGLAEALERISAAIAAAEHIVVYGDYDVDGLSGSTLLALALRAVGANVEVFIPHRARDGYGLSAAVLERLAARAVGLVISVDCGVTAAVEIAGAAAAGVDVIVTDHHRVPSELPPAVAVLNPHRTDCRYPFKMLAGAGVAFRLAEAVVSRFARPGCAAAIEPKLFELAALGTIADVMPLIGENRTIVRRGLRQLNQAASPGLGALAKLARLAPGWIDAEAIAFKVAPRLNAAGRLDDAIMAQRLLAVDTDADAVSLAEGLEAFNDRRRAMTDDALLRARAELGSLLLEPPPAIVVAGEYPIGLLGLVAARLAEDLRRPVAVIEMADVICRGSVRAVPGFDAAAAVAACGDLLLQFGGHSGAAGFSLVPGNLEAFRACFIAAATPMFDALPSIQAVTADCRLRPESITWGLCEDLAQLEPTGQGNSPPLFETQALRVREARVVGGRHLRLSLISDRTRLSAILFDGADHGPHAGELVDLLYRVRRRLWQDTVSIELEVAGWRPAETAA